MKKSLKKLFVLPLAATFIASCTGPTESSVDSSNSTTSSSSSESKVPEVVHVESVSLNKTSLEMHIGDKEELTASVLPANADNKALNWSSSDKEVASVEDGKITALKAGEATITATSVDGNKSATCTINVLEDALTFNIRTGSGAQKALTQDINFDNTQKDTIILDVKKNNKDWFDADIKTVISGDEGIISSANKDETADNTFNVVFSGKTGSATITFSIEGYSQAGTLSVTYNVAEYFLNQTIRRGSATEADNKITLDGSAQHAALVKKKDTNWVLKATLDITKYSGDESVGLGGFADAGDHALWFGLKNNDKAADNCAGIYMLDFYDGWGARKDIPSPKAYENLGFEENEGKTAIKVDFEVIRNGLEYYYNIGGHHGKYTSTFAAASYAGFYSQQKEVVITNYSIAYGQEAATAAIGSNYTENAKIDAGTFLNPNVNEIVRGESRSFNVDVAPSYSKEAYSLVTDEAYAEHVSIEGLKITIKSTAPKGNMTLTLKSASGKALDSIILPVEEQSSEKSNDQLTVKGGVILNDDGSIVFPESKMDIDGVGNEAAYDDSVQYGATLKEQVLGGDFTIEFDVSDYKTTAQFPKLMVSLGGVESQFYLAYGYAGGGNSRIETNTYSSQYYGGQWNNTEDFPSFDKTASHHFKIESKNGYYNFYVDGSTTPLAQKCDNDARNIIVPMDSYYRMLPVRFSTKGVSAKVSNISVTSGNANSLKDIYTYSNRAKSLEGGFETNFQKVGWEVRDRVSNGMFASKLFAEATGAYTAKFDITFSKMTSDAKFAIAFNNNHEFHFCNAGNGSKVENYPGHWGGPSVSGIALSETNLTLPVTLVNNGDGTVSVSVPLSNGEIGTVTDNGVSKTSGIYFWAFNQNDADEKATVTVSNVQIQK